MNAPKYMIEKIKKDVLDYSDNENEIDRLIDLLKGE